MSKRRKDPRAIAGQTRRRHLRSKNYVALYVLQLVRYGGPFVVTGILGMLLFIVIQEPIRKYSLIAGFWEIVEQGGSIILIVSFLVISFYSGYITYKDSKDIGGEDD
jgi:hypothetical protein